MPRWEPNRAQIEATARAAGLRLVSPAVRTTTNLAKARVPRDTGRTANSIGSDIRTTRNAVIGKVGSRAKTAMWLHRGTPAHVIRPKRPGGRLRFYWERVGQVVVFTKVNHPGIGGTPYLTSSMRDACRPLGFKVTVTDEGRPFASRSLRSRLFGR
jgi:hypothetical protein